MGVWSSVPVEVQILEVLNCREYILQAEQLLLTRTSRPEYFTSLLFSVFIVPMIRKFYHNIQSVCKGIYYVRRARDGDNNIPFLELC